MKPVRTVSDWVEAWFAWLPVTGVAWAVSLALGAAMATGLARVLPIAVAWALAGIVAGALLGLVQWLLLNPKVQGIGLWVLATAVGWVAGLIVAALAASTLGPVPGTIAGGILGGSLMGCAQFLCLRRDGKRADWVLMTSAGWSVAVAVSLAIKAEGWGFPDGPISIMAVSGAVGLLVLALLAVPARAVLFPDFGKKDATGYERWWP